MCAVVLKSGGPRGSPAVRQEVRKQQVLSSNLSVGSTFHARSAALAPSSIDMCAAKTDAGRPTARPESRPTGRRLAHGNWSRDLVRRESFEADIPSKILGHA